MTIHKAEAQASSPPSPPLGLTGIFGQVQWDYCMGRPRAVILEPVVDYWMPIEGVAIRRLDAPISIL